MIFFLQEDTKLIAVKKSLERGTKNGRWSLSEINTLIIWSLFNFIFLDAYSFCQGIRKKYNYFNVTSFFYLFFPILFTSVRILEGNCFISFFVEIKAHSTERLKRWSNCHSIQVWQSQSNNDGKEICQKVCCTFRVLFYLFSHYPTFFPDWLSSTRIRWIWQTNPKHFLIRYESGVVWTLNPDISFLSGDVTTIQSGCF